MPHLDTENAYRQFLSELRDERETKTGKAFPNWQGRNLKRSEITADE